MPSNTLPRSSRVAIGLTLLFTMAVLTACSAGTGSQLADHAYLSVAVTEGGVAKPLVAGTRIRIDGGVLISDSLAMTEMGCDAARHAQDDWLAKFLGSRPTIRLSGDELTLESGTTVVRLLDRKVVEPDVALSGPTWTVVSIISGDAVSSIPDGATATLVFSADGTVTVNAGCNQGGGTWKAVAGGIELSAIGMTKKACDGVAGQLEAAVMAVLGTGTVAAAIDSNVLTLRAGANGLQLRAS